MADASTWPKARDLRDRVMFQRRVDTPSPLGGTTGAWYTLISSRSAKLIPFRPRRKGGDEVQGARLQGTAPYDLWVRWDSQTSQVTSDDRVVDLRNPERVFKIGFVEDMDRRNLWLVFQLELGVANG
jgi:head-tail adaptor